MLRIYLTILLATLVGVGACKKKTTAPQVAETLSGNARTVIVNKIPDSVYITLSGHDIKTGTLPHIIRITLPPGDTMIIPRADLIDAYHYQYDWHTADYRYSNWFMADGNGNPQKPSFDYYGDTADYTLEVNGVQRNELLICLDGDGLSSTWKAVGAFNAAGVSVWDTLPAKSKVHSFVISRYHTVKHYYIDTANKNVSTNLAFRLPLLSDRVTLVVEQQADSYILSNNLNPNAPLTTNANDTLYYSPIKKGGTGADTPPPYYLLKRQSIER